MSAETLKDAKQEAVDHELNLSQLLEKKFAGFVKKIKHSNPNGLYALLISECEKPIFKLALQETDGNQVRAARLLGVNRNTLKKKMKEFKISVIKKDKRRALSAKKTRP
ncbi:MAG: site-specific DNA inversion stimulation factor [Nitrospirae bacterium]|nr:site-specific DNA inversion stimulation factor [Candidatus Troglogloeales bacterium]